MSVTDWTNEHNEVTSDTGDLNKIEINIYDDIVVIE